ncbi:hypothetical protein [Hyalangium versicolor]|uniref:hypothetical protein n=1 Tax=Hyalangium versicolor TaxID=2861190 RepID=UPI001CCC9458|nr:hypothetical protein [Hyalangium versicolor]
MRTNYIAFTATDAPFIVKTGGTPDQLKQEFVFNIPQSIDTQHNAVLMFMVNGTAGSNNLVAQVAINNNVVSTYGPADTALTRPFHEIFPGGFLKTGNNNKIAVQIVGGSGTFKVSDVVIWFMDNQQ